MKDRTTLSHATRDTKLTVITTEAAKMALTILISSPTPAEAGNAVKTLNAYFDAVNELIEAVEELNQKAKEVTK